MLSHASVTNQALLLYKRRNIKQRIGRVSICSRAMLLRLLFMLNAELIVFCFLFSLPNIFISVCVWFSWHNLHQYCGLSCAWVAHCKPWNNESRCLSHSLSPGHAEGIFLRSAHARAEGKLSAAHRWQIGLQQKIPLDCWQYDQLLT